MVQKSYNFNVHQIINGEILFSENNLLTVVTVDLGNHDSEVHQVLEIKKEAATLFNRQFWPYTQKGSIMASNCGKTIGISNIRNSCSNKRNYILIFKKYFPL